MSFSHSLLCKENGGNCSRSETGSQVMLGKIQGHTDQSLTYPLRIEKPKNHNNSTFSQVVHQSPNKVISF